MESRRPKIFSLTASVKILPNSGVNTKFRWVKAEEKLLKILNGT